MRLPDWRARLRTYVSEASRASFRPGSHDCALFAAGAVKAMTGSDPAKGFRGYRTLKAGQAKLVKKGFADHIALAADLFEEVPPAMAQVGDIAVVDTPEQGAALGIVQGPCIYVLRLDGLGTVPLTEARRAFRV